MKNYLFAPFNDEGEQIEGFNAIRDYLPNKYRNALIMFMARLESTYDVIISKLEADNSSFHGQYDKIQELKAEVERYKFHAETRANELVKRGAKLKELQAEIRQLKADAKHDADVCYDVDDKHVEIIKALEEQLDDLIIDKDRLIKQVSSNRGNSSSTHTHTIGSVKCSIAREIAEYMNNNPKSKGARMFLLPRCDFKKDGEHDGGYFYWEDGME